MTRCFGSMDEPPKSNAMFKQIKMLRSTLMQPNKSIFAAVQSQASSGLKSRNKNSEGPLTNSSSQKTAATGKAKFGRHQSGMKVSVIQEEVPASEEVNLQRYFFQLTNIEKISFKVTGRQNILSIMNVQRPQNLRQRCCFSHEAEELNFYRKPELPNHE